MQFQNYGRFNKKITAKTNTNALLATHQNGSFDITILVPLAVVAAEAFVNVPVGYLMSYVFERILGKSSDSQVRDVLDRHAQVVEELGRIKESDSESLKKALEIVDQQRQDLKDSNDYSKKVLERRIAELEREKMLEPVEDQMKRIDGAQQEKLLAMAAPLVAEMATVLRVSAYTVEIFDESRDGKAQRFLYLDREMAEDVIVSKVDDQITSIRVDIVQYNKETGWGKLRLADSRDLITFSVPADLKGNLTDRIVQEMKNEQTFVRVNCVRDRAQEPTRMILVGIIDE
ncbi:hypothetical protein EV659_10681 [Rhodothalassium salexigens DSM 2132]|uniref:Uncharacterized protein n=2 Tax=Rhodothalassium salexigens TaxID=1086 RepID=A0A4R2PF51_RHOSA|nr:hypothetical protein EV659_10681 [Rhodothalassium salexigens DSM 2132]